MTDDPSDERRLLLIRLAEVVDDASPAADLPLGALRARVEAVEEREMLLRCGVPLSDPLDTWRAARALVDRYGSDAPIQAALRVDELAAARDDDGHRVWRAILAAIDELQRTDRAQGEAQH